MKNIDGDIENDSNEGRINTTDRPNLKSIHTGTRKWMLQNLGSLFASERDNANITDAGNHCVLIRTDRSVGSTLWTIKIRPITNKIGLFFVTIAQSRKVSSSPRRELSINLGRSLATERHAQNAETENSQVANFLDMKYF